MFLSSPRNGVKAEQDDQDEDRMIRIRPKPGLCFILFIFFHPVPSCSRFRLGIGLRRNKMIRMAQDDQDKD